MDSLISFDSLGNRRRFRCRNYYRKCQLERRFVNELTTSCQSKGICLRRVLIVLKAQSRQTRCPSPHIPTRAVQVPAPTETPPLPRKSTVSAGSSRASLPFINGFSPHL